MKTEDAISLLQNPEFPQAAGEWADFGCGSGFFTQALAQMLAPGSVIHAVDKDMGAFRVAQLPAHVSVTKREADIATQILPFSGLTGILLANFLHFIRDKVSLVAQMIQYLGKDGIFLVIEYDTDIASRWVPYPLPFGQLKDLFEPAGFRTISRTHTIPSVYQPSGIYGAWIGNKK